MRILVLNAHPDEGSFCDAVTAAYVDGARAAGHRSIALRELRFDLVLRGGFHSAKPLEPDIAEQQQFIRWCQHPRRGVAQLVVGGAGIAEGLC